ncbi:MAG: YbaN family protein [Bacteroidales bacterium]|nr:YbaN family protein [Bacteroidales bacterium]
MKKILALLGIVSLVLGIIGMFLPVLPTTPFLLLSSWLFMKSSDRLYYWLMNHRVFGPYIQDFMVHKSIPLHTKVIAITMLWVSLICCALFATDKLILRIMFLTLATGVTIHILRYKTKK